MNPAARPVPAAGNPWADLSSRAKSLLFLAAFLTGTSAVYLPALRGGFVWDDDYYVTRNAALEAPGGLKRIWLEPGATPQYYPLAFTSFWVERRIWGMDPAGYHLVNVLTHAANAFLLGLLLTALGVRGAWFAAALFALHPVQVESAAWISERKNVLSGFFSLAAALVCVRSGFFSEETPADRRAAPYAGAFALFVAALLSKSVAATWPAAMLLLLWWKRGAIRRGDVLRFAPFFVVAAAMGSVTAGLERRLGAQGAAWDFSPVERLLIAGRALWFYAGKLAWPAELSFVYPRWEIDAARFPQYVFPAAALAVLGFLWARRAAIGRGPLTAALFFAGTLTPALGFFNVYPMRFSFVADHFQYLASAGLMALAGAFWARDRVTPVRRAAGAAWLAVLALLTWRQAGAYESLETLWRDTLSKNPAAWIAHSNLGLICLARGDLDDALRHCAAAVEHSPGDHDLLNNLGTVYERKGESAKAAELYVRAVRAKPAHYLAHSNLGRVFWALGDLDAAEASLSEAVRLQPDYPEAHNILGAVYLQKGLPDRAAACYERILAINPSDHKAWNNLGEVRLRQKDFDGAAAHARKAVERRPDFARGYFTLGRAHLARGDAASFRAAVESLRALGAADLADDLLRQAPPAKR